MIDVGDANWWMATMSVLSLIGLLLALVIVFKAFRGYRQNDDRGMFLLALGLFLLLLAPFPVGLATTVLFEETVEVEMALSVVQQLLRISGLATILASMYVRR